MTALFADDDVVEQVLQADAPDARVIRREGPRPRDSGSPGRLQALHKSEELWMAA